MPERITLYSAKICPFAHRTEIALAEAKADFTRYEIDLENKPEWYAPKVNPASKVPTIAYGGPAAPPESPSPQSVKIAESLVIVEFIGDLFPHASILPADPVKRAQARFFVEGVSSKLLPAYFQFLQGKGPAEGIYTAVEYLQALLPAEGFAVGEYSVGDIAITPFLARARAAFSNDLGGYPSGEGAKVIETLTNKQGKFARFAKYWEDLNARESFKATWHEAHVVETMKVRYANYRK